MPKPLLLELLDGLGYAVTVGYDAPDHPHGPRPTTRTARACCCTPRAAASRDIGEAALACSGT